MHIAASSCAAVIHSTHGCGPMRESTQQGVLHDQSCDVFMALLEYLYTDRVQACRAHAVEFALDLLSVADQFLVEPLKMLCENAIQKSICVDNVASMLATADARSAVGLQKVLQVHPAPLWQSDWDAGIQRDPSRCSRRCSSRHQARCPRDEST